MRLGFNHAQMSPIHSPSSCSNLVDAPARRTQQSVPAVVADLVNELHGCARSIVGYPALSGKMSSARYKIIARLKKSYFVCNWMTATHRRHDLVSLWIAIIQTGGSRWRLQETGCITPDLTRQESQSGTKGGRTKRWSFAVWAPHSADGPAAAPSSALSSSSTSRRHSIRSQSWIAASDQVASLLWAQQPLRRLAQSNVPNCARNPASVGRLRLSA